MNAAVRIRRGVASPLAALLLVSGGVSAAAIAFSATPVAAATVVSTPADLVSAWSTATSIQFANDITLTCATSQLNRSSTNGDVIVDGQGHTLSETCAQATMVVTGGADSVTVQNLTLTTDGTPFAGAIEMDGGTGNLTLNGVTMTNNHNTGGGAVEMTDNGSGNLTVQNSTLMNNASCDSNGGAIEYSPGGNVVISGSTIANNQTGSDGGAIAMDGSSNNLTVTNSTITGNTANRVGGLEVDHGNLTLTYVTDVNNTTGVPFLCPVAAGSAPNTNSEPADPPPAKAEPGVGSQLITVVHPANLRVDQTDDSGQGVKKLTTFGSVIAQPHGGPNCGDFAGPTTGPLTNTVSNGWNFADDTSCGLTGTGDSQVSTNDPLLGALTNNGGRNPTLLPQTGSPLIDKIPLASCPAGAGITIDERMLPRPSGPGCDIGAVEIQVAAAIVITPKFTG
jgi:Right handed beta helix region